MSERAASPRPASPKKKRRSKPSTHPPVAEMVRAAIVSIKDRKGSSLPAIKKYIEAKYRVNMLVIAPFIRRFLKRAVAAGSLKQASGTGASGRFRLGKAAPKKKKKKAKKPKKKAKKPKAKKAKKPKKKKAKKPKAKKARKPKAAKKPRARKAAKKAPRRKKKAAKKSSRKAAKK